ncbi:hypothetical protein EOA32_33220 [Mesorhizobium sp. M1A.F.Ca.ET.072.01.1.1]|nr:hypothetical protein EOA32_33220 [Mesorhizobium sp. M1A.F.Ca.ET.072.01.1.1]TIU96973.1 MAG: plasmid pRiA4b ORF-3 family protein [Mesorhizobium sp.]
MHGRHYGTTSTGKRHRDAAGREVTLANLQLRGRQRIRYEYDFGDRWEHDLRVEARAIGRQGLPGLHRRRACRSA